MAACSNTRSTVYSPQCTPFPPSFPPLSDPPMTFLVRTLPLLAIAAFASLAGGCREPELSEPEDVIGRMIARMQADLGEAGSFMVVSDSALVHFQRVTSNDSLPAFLLTATTNDEARQQIADPYHLPAPSALAQLRTTGRLAGQDTLDGRTVYVIDALNPREFLMLNPAIRSDSGYVARVYVDAETFRVAALRVEQPPPPDAPRPEAGPLVQMVRYQDYRESDGLVLPHRTRLRLEGLLAVTAEEDKIVAGADLAMRRAQAEQLPPTIRARRLAEVDREIRFYDEGILTGTFTVREVQVGAPSPLREAPAPAAAAPAAPVP
jgi:hypothetical protein